MRLSLRNIGKIHSADVDINGITVIAGENNTGKSTVGKALYATFNSFYHIDQRIHSERREAIENSLARANFSVAGEYAPNHYPQNIELINRLLSLSEANDTFKVLHQKVTGILLSSEQQYIKDEDSAVFVELSRRIAVTLGLPNDDIVNQILQKQLNAEFNSQISNLFSSDQFGSILLEIQGKVTRIVIDSDRVILAESHQNLQTSAVYIDDPFILDEVSPLYRSRAQHQLGHRAKLKSMLISGAQKESIIDEIITNNKLEEIYSKLSSVCEGDITRTNSSSLSYRTATSTKAVDVKNLSTGLKTFVILKLLLTSGNLEENGTVILDEPEIHLHPEWQLLLAELIVLLQKKFGLHILLNTHSPYFLNAIEVYATKYGIGDKCKYYLAENKEGGSFICDVTEDVEKIYDKLARPLQILENERYSNGEA